MRKRSAVIRLSIIALICNVMLLGSALAAPKAETWKGELPIRQPWLRDHLPDESLAYVRIPHIFGLLATPKGSSLDAALRSKANVENVEKIRRGITDNVLPQIPAFASIQLRLIEQHLRSPIEVAFFLGDAPSALIAVNIDLESDDTLAAALELMGMPLVEPLDADGMAQIEGAPVPAFLQFDASNGRLLIFGGPTVTDIAFAEILSSTARDSRHPMSAMEARIDQSGHGLFVWLDAQQALPLLQSTLPPETATKITESGLNKVTAAAAGWGVADGKGRLSLVADLPADGERGFIPVVSNDISAMSVGDPDALFVLSMPTASEFSRLEGLALESADTDAQLEWNDARSTFKEFTGFAVEEIFEALGPEIVAIFDAAGDYMAVRLRNPKQWESMVSRVSEKAGQRPDKRRIDGVTYYHINVPNELSLLDEKTAGEIGWFAVLMARQREHLYWMQEDDFLYIASVPQVLIERSNRRARTHVGSWLKDKQRIEADAAIFSLSGTGRKLPKRLYSIYIELLQFLADIAEVEIDVWSMPTSQQLGLPGLGTLGFTVNLGDPTLSAELTFENNPGELFGGLGGIAMTGILAAIAIPAYQDYTVRAQISEGLNLSAAQKADIAEFYFDRNRFPNEQEADAMSQFELESENVVSVIVEPDDGSIVVQYAHTVAGGGEIVLAATVNESGQITWNCSGSFEDKHLPAACRGAAMEYFEGDET